MRVHSEIRSATSDALRHTLEHAPTPIATTEGFTHVLNYVNPAFCRLLDRPARQLLGRPFAEILPAMDKCLTLLARVYHSGRPESQTEANPTAPNRYFWSYTIWPVIVNNIPTGIILHVTETAHFHAATLAMNEALLLGAVRQHELATAAAESNILLLQEIDERKLAAAALQRAQDELSGHADALEGLVAERTSELTSTNQQLEAFIYSIAHDLRAPLRAMQGFSTLLLEEIGPGLSDTGKSYARRINGSAQFMDALLLDLLAFSRVSQQRIELGPVDLATVVESVLARLRESIEEKCARVERPGPWPCVLAHELTLTQMLVNLISNALKFLGPNAAPVLRLHTEEAGPFLRIWVEDNGIGIDPAHQEQIFRPFTRLNGETYPGTGIGLAIVQKGAERMGGRAGVESVPHQGSRFWFELLKT